ncbi:MAG: AI-2E family transporter [Candidatus Paceibacterota bacterium]
MNTKISPKYFFFGLLIITLGLTLFLFKPFFSVLVLSASLALVFSPLYKWLQSKMTWQSGWLASILTTFVFVIVLCGPLFLIGKLIFQQSADLYQSLTSTYGSNQFLEDLELKISGFLPDGIDVDLKKRVADVVATLSDDVGKIFSSTLHTLFSFLLIIFSMFYFLKDGHRWKKMIIFLSPLPDSYDKKVIQKLKQAVNGIMVGYLFIGFAQGALLGIGLAIFGIPNAVLFGVVAAVASLVPMVGTGLVAIPIILFLFATGDTASAVGLSIWSGVVVGLSDEILRPIVIGTKLNIPPLLVLFAVLGGISLLGPIGVLVGPLCISLLHALISIYRDGENI